MPGKIVKTKSGKVGTTKNKDGSINGKIPVYLDDGGKTLCDPRTLEIIGNWD